MSKQTALTKAIQYVKEELLSNEDNTIRQSARHAIQILTDLLPYERDVIEETYKKGEFNFGASIFDDGSDCISSTDYFTKTFTNGND